MTSYLMTILGFQSDALKSKMERVLFFQDETVDGTDCLAPGGRKKRAAYTNQSKEVHLSCPLFTPLALQNRLMVNTI